MRVLSNLLVVGMSLASGACLAAKDVECSEQGHCDLDPGGVCVAASTGNQWCAYPDASCTSGLRYSDFDVGDGLSGVCVSTDTQLASLTVEKDGFGAGTVSGTTPTQTTVIDCGIGAGCSTIVDGGTIVTLTATAASGDIFHGWSGGGCSGTGNCITTVSVATTVTATFDQCDRALAEHCDNTTNVFEQCSAEGQASAAMTCPLYCSTTFEKCVDIDPSDDPTTNPLNAQMDLLAGAGQDLVFPSSCTAATCSIDTFDGQILGAATGAGSPSEVVEGVGRVFRVETLSLAGVVKVRGNRPLVVLANGAVTLVGVLDASADGKFPGPGAQDLGTICSGRFYRSANTVTPGAGGGGRATYGSRGGNSNTGISGTNGGMMQNEAMLIPLVGGCGGGWVDESGGSAVTNVGAGGGAVQIVSRESIALIGNGVIDVSGGGAPSGDDSITNPTFVLGGAGGGSGGSVLLEAPIVTLDGGGVVLSAKGGGGAAAGARGFNGADGGYGPGVASGGVNPNGADGGAGGNETTPPAVGQNAQGSIADGGGGGGSVGYCRINTRTGAIVLQNGAAIRCVRQTNTVFAERLLP